MSRHGISVGDRDVLRGGVVIECVEVYDDNGRSTGRWIEIGHIDSAADPDSLWEYGWNTGSEVDVIGTRAMAEEFGATFGAVPGEGDWGSRFLRRYKPGEWQAIP